MDLSRAQREIRDTIVFAVRRCAHETPLAKKDLWSICVPGTPRKFLHCTLEGSGHILNPQMALTHL